MLLRRLIYSLVMASVVLLPGMASADRMYIPNWSNTYYRTSYYHGQPPTFPPQPRNEWYKYGYFGAYPVHRTITGGHYSHRNHYTELRFSAPR